MTSQKQNQTRSPELSRSPFCAMLRTEQEYGNEGLPRAPCVARSAVFGHGRGSDGNNGGHNEVTVRKLKKAAPSMHLYIA
eukprot:11755851-Alexandrium_andersonii.AAC.1